MLDPRRDRHAWIEDPRLAECGERHQHTLPEPTKSASGGRIEIALDGAPSVDGVVVRLDEGLPLRRDIRDARRAVHAGLGVWFWWPEEQVVERATLERLESFDRHLTLANLVRTGRRVARAPIRVTRRALSLSSRIASKVPPVARRLHAFRHREAIEQLAAVRALLEDTAANARPVPFPANTDREPLAYVRTDFWATIDSGGSYGHTCYVAKELAARGADLVCYMPHRYELLDAMGLRQVVLDAPFTEWPEWNITRTTIPTLHALRAAFAVHRPCAIYERLVLGNFAGARLSQDFGIPYIVEYNGSEISMKRSFEGAGYEHEELYEEMEAVAFRQASLISVVSEPVKADLVERGIDPSKILVDPNGADPDVYRPLEPNDRANLRSELGFDASDTVIGFTGTFGGWHGIDVLAAGIPRVCREEPRARFLLIGDGNFKHLVDAAAREHRLEDRVLSVGRVPQEEGRRLLGACDVFVSPHSAHMEDRTFFGSPTKLFEYMALGGAVVASDIAQIGQVLTPAMRADRLDAEDDPGDLLAILCAPGSVDDFVHAVTHLVRHPALGRRLGANARLAVLERYSWSQHIDRLWRAAAGEPVDALADEALSATPPGAPALGAAGTEPSEVSPAPLPPRMNGAVRLKTGDVFKDQSQEQWDRDACGSHYVKDAPEGTLDWYREAEEYRFGTYAPWMPDVMEFADHSGEDVLEIGAGMGTDLSQFAQHGARVTDIDLSAGHLDHARRNFELRGLAGRFIHHDAESLPFDDASFDLVYSNGVIHHTPNTQRVITEIRRVLRPGGRTVLMVYAENSLHYWRNLFYDLGVKEGRLGRRSMGEIMSESVEISEYGQRPLVKVYTRRRARELMEGFAEVEILQRQMLPNERPRVLRWLPTSVLERVAGWNLIVKAEKPR